MANKSRIKPRAVKRSDSLAEDIRRKIQSGAVRPGETILQEKDLLSEYKVSKGTAREALKSLEVQGLVKIKTGPGGGASVAEVTADKATELLWNYFFSKKISLKHIYAVRRVLEPMLVRDVTNDLGREDFERLSIHLAKCRAAKQPVVAIDLALEFHDLVAQACSNPVLAFYIRFVMALVRRILAEDIPKRATKDVKALLEHGLANYEKLLIAFKDRDADAAERIMAEHVAGAERLVLRLSGEAEPQ